MSRNSMSRSDEKRDRSELEFRPDRLVSARKRRGLTMTALAVRAGMAAPLLSRYQTGKTVPGEAVVESLAEALSYPKMYFYREPGPQIPAEGVSFRSLRRTPARQRDAMTATAEAAWEVEEWIAARYERNTSEVPDLDAREFEPDAAAAMVREAWGLGVKPIPHLLRVLEAKGVRIYSIDPTAEGSQEGRNVSGLSLWWQGAPFVFLSPGGTAERMRMSAAHELAHLVMHRHGALTGQAAEKQANQFAGAFLVPKEDLLAYPPRPDLGAIIRLKSRWGVSAMALVYRMKEVGLLEPWRYQDLCIRIRGTYGSDEPAEGRRERSAYWARLLAMMREDGIGVRDLARDVDVRVEDVHALLRGLVMIPEPTGDADAESSNERRLRLEK